MEKSYDMSRFADAQRADFPAALREVKAGRKTSHWMWYIFPQIKGLGRSSTSRFYAISDLDEAKAFMNDEYLRGNLIEISKALLELETDDPLEVFGIPDNVKLCSSMTLFSYATDDNSVFLKVLDKFFGGEKDPRTISILNLK